MHNLDISLVLPPCWGTQMPALGISYLTSYLRQKRHKVKVFDMNIDFYNSVPCVEKKWWRPDKLKCWTDRIALSRLFDTRNSYFDAYVDKILSGSSKAIGFSIYDSNRVFALEIAMRIKKKDPAAFIIFGGAGCCNEEKRSMMAPDLVDLIVVGEGEEALSKVIEHINSGTVVCLGRIIFSAPVTNINSIPYPAFDDYNLKLYEEAETLPVLMSRGCIGRCSFCNDHYLSGPYRSRDAKDVLTEIKHHRKAYGIRSFNFQDLAVNGQIENLDYFCRLLFNYGLDINWTAQAIPYGKMTEKVLKNVRASGCTVLIYGLESGSNKTLGRMGKFFSREIAQKVIRDTHNAGINVFINLIVGFPGETEAEFQETISFIRENREYIDNVSSLNTCCVNNDTDLERYCDKYKIVLPENPETRAIYWKEEDGADYAIRSQRLKEMLSFLRNVNFPVTQTNIHDAEAI